MEEDAEGGPPIGWEMMMMMEDNNMTFSQSSSWSDNIEMFLQVLLVFLFVETIYCPPDTSTTSLAGSTEVGGHF